MYAKLNKQQQQQQHQQEQQQNIIIDKKLTTTTETTTSYLPTYNNSCSIIKVQNNNTTTTPTINNNYLNPAETTHMSLIYLRRRRRHACLLSILLAFVCGLLLGVLLPMFGLTVLPTTTTEISSLNAQNITLNISDATLLPLKLINNNKKHNIKAPRPIVNFPTIYETKLPQDTDTFSIAFIKETNNIEKKLSSTSSSIKHINYIKSNIYWSNEIEDALPRGYSMEDAKNWQNYINKEGIVKHLEIGCGRMQNRLLVFADGSRACARYRQNTDQIQGELFSFYLGQLLNISNLAPSAAAVVDLNSETWSTALSDIQTAQWKQQRPVVLTRWLSELEPAGIPKPFQTMERHLNKFDIWNLTKTNLTRDALMPRLIELAQWSDLIVFDYLIANLDRVVNNLYNYQWNADIMAAPAHNLARQTNSQLLVFLDNESGLLHGYRLLKKYEAYHGLLLDNLCVFRQPTIQALQLLREQGVGSKLRELFEKSTTIEVRDVLPALPDKSIKILLDRIDRVLTQVQKCKDLLTDS